MVIHHELYLYLTNSRDDYWISEGDTIHITKEKDGTIFYETSDYEDAGRFPKYFTYPENSYHEWLEKESEGGRGG